METAGYQHSSKYLYAPQNKENDDRIKIFGWTIPIKIFDSFFQ